jgi:hypothetical protein
LGVLFAPARLQHGDCRGQRDLHRHLLRRVKQKWPVALRAILYLIGMIWCFMGVAIVADLFMGAIEEITTKIYIKVDKDTNKRRVFRFWNPTVANLSLMALGSSAPEIMLNVVEVRGCPLFRVQINKPTPGIPSPGNIAMGLTHWAVPARL